MNIEGKNFSIRKIARLRILRYWSNKNNNTEWIKRELFQYEEIN